MKNYIIILLFLVNAGLTSADIYQWQWIDESNHELGKQQSIVLCPGGSGVDAVPYSDLRNLDLTKGYFIGADLSNASFEGRMYEDRETPTILTYADFSYANLTNVIFDVAILGHNNFQYSNLENARFSEMDLGYADFTGANLTNAGFGLYSLNAGVIFKDAIVNGMSFACFNQVPIPAEMIYETASYKNKDLSGIKLPNQSLIGWDLSGQNLSIAMFDGSDLTGTTFKGSDLYSASFSYADLSNADFSDCNLTGVGFSDAIMVDANFNNSIIRGVYLGNIQSPQNFTAEQLYSTASYKNGDLSGIVLDRSDLRGWDFSGQNLSFSALDESLLMGVNLSDANLLQSNCLNSNFENANLSGANLSFGFFDLSNMTRADLHNADLSFATFHDAIFADAYLAGCTISHTMMWNSDFSRADLRRAKLYPSAYDIGIRYNNTIQTNGVINPLILNSEETLIIRDMAPWINKLGLPVEMTLPIQIMQGMSMEESSGLRFVFQDKNWGSIIKFEEGIEILLNGKIELTFSDGVNVNEMIGTTFKLFDWTNSIPNGQFSEIITDPNHFWDTSRLYTTGEVTFGASPPNSSPIANAGSNQTTHVGTLVTLDGGSSSDPDGNYPLSYKWRITSQPQGSNVELFDENLVNPCFYPDIEGDYTVELIVTDSMGTNSEPASVTISTYNTMPIAEAGPDQAVILVGSEIQLDGSQSYDEDGDNITYQWVLLQKPDGSDAVLSNPTAIDPNFVADKNGDYIITLIVTDCWGSSSESDSIKVSFDNIKPIANPGGNRAVVEGELVCFDGSLSSDENGDSLTYSWSVVSAPADSNATLSATNIFNPCILVDVSGSYVISLVVFDGIVYSDPQNITVMVISNEDAATGELTDAIELINSLEPAIFKNKNMCNALTNKINSVLELIDQGFYIDALEKLQNDILGKTDGCAEIGEPDANDWLKSCQEQQDVYPFLLQALVYLQQILQE